MLSGFDRKVSAIRDSALLRPRSIGTMHVLRSLRRLISETVDISAVAAELVRYSQNKRSFLYDIASFTRRNREFYRDKNITLSDALRKRIEERAAWLGNTNHSIRDLFVQHSTVVGTHENIKLQRYVIVLSVLALIISIIAIWVSGENSETLKAIPRWLQQTLPRAQ